MKQIEKIIKSALREDINGGDITTMFFIDKKSLFKGVMIAKSNMILCGTDFAITCFRLLNNNLKVKKLKNDGDFVKKKEIIMEIISDRSILSAERTALNIVQRLSGIASKTHNFVKIAEKYGVSIFDTRKTTPNLRIMEKYAVNCGGGVNHRFGLFDAFMIKDNHIKAFNNLNEIEKKIKIARKKHPEKEIEIEAQNIKQASNFADLDIDVIMLDNIKLKDAKKAIEIIRKKRKDIEIEISGGITEKNFVDYLKLKPDRISIGALTHSYDSADISLEIEKIR
ncbi:MAG: carboxylating nicotinate-nucleotide diphosphorylase [Elusimicrobiota bacterium]